jgi:hypothetical protein
MPQDHPATHADLLGIDLHQVSGLLDSPVFWLPNGLRDLFGVCDAPVAARRAWAALYKCTGISATVEPYKKSSP